MGYVAIISSRSPPGIFVKGGEEGRPDCRKNNSNNIIFNPQLILQFYRGGGGSNIFQGGGPTFSRGGDPDAYIHKNALNL